MPTDPLKERILRRDFPLSQEGYDRTAVDAHLAAIAATIGRPVPGGADPAAEAEFELIASARLLLGQISLMRTEMQRVSASLLQQSLTIAEALERLESSGSSDPPEGARVEAGASLPPRDDLPAESASGPSSSPRDDLPAESASGPSSPAHEDLFGETGPATAARGELPAEAPPRPAASGPSDAAMASLAPTSEPRSADPDRARAGAALEDARLVALDMALGGSSREEIDRELSERFDLVDRAGLVEAVLAAIS